MRTVDLQLRMRVLPTFPPGARSRSRCELYAFDMEWKGSQETAEQDDPEMLRLYCDFGGA